MMTTSVCVSAKTVNDTSSKEDGGIVNGVDEQRIINGDYIFLTPF